MPIAVIVDTFPRWSERFIARELNELKRRGIDFWIYCLRAGDAECSLDGEFANLIPRRVVLPACFVPSAARDLGMDAAALARKKLVEKELGFTAFRQVGCANSLVKLLREHRVRLVYAHFASLPSTLGWLAAEAMKLPFVVSAHARDVFVEGQLVAEKLKSARRFFTCHTRACYYLRENIEGLEPWPSDGDGAKTVLMHHGLPLEEYGFHPRQARWASGNGLKLLAAGRFVPKKGFMDLIEALADPALTAKNVTLTLLGEGPEQKAFTKRIAQLGLNGRVTMPGPVQGDALRAYFDDAGAFVVPSVNMQDGDSDGVPNVVLEAFALGIPVIGTQAGSLGDVLREDGSGATGAVIEEHDPQALARAVEWVMAEPEAVAMRVLNARRLVEAEYDIRKTVEPLVAALEP